MTYHPAVFYMKTNDVLNPLGVSNIKSKEEPRWTTTATDLLLCGSLAISCYFSQQFTFHIRIIQ